MAEYHDRAQRFHDLGKEWFKALREVYKENLALTFEAKPIDQTKVEMLGAKLAVLSDLEQELIGVISQKTLEDEE